MVIKLKTRLATHDKQGVKGEGSGESIPCRDKSMFKGPGVGKSEACLRNQKNADRFQTWSLWHRG